MATKIVRVLVTAQRYKPQQCLSARLSCVREQSSDCIVRSPYPNVDIPKRKLHEVVWRDLEQWSDKIACECAITGRRFTYIEARERSRKIAAVLQQVFQLKKGECFALISTNCPDYILICLAASEAGVVLTPINPAYTSGEIARQLLDSNATLVISMPGKVEAVQAAGSKINKPLRIVTINDHLNNPPPSGTISLEAVLKDSKAMEPEEHEWSSEDNVFLPYSSGTTGLPKGVELCHRTLVSNLSQAMDPNIRMYEPSKDGWQEVVMTQLPCYHIYGLMLIGIKGLALGTKSVILPTFEPETFINTINKYKVTNLPVAPPLAFVIGNHPSATREKMSSVRYMICGAAPLGPKDFKKCKEKMPESLIIQGYGMTEASPLLTINVHKFSNKLASCGITLPNTELKVVDVNTGKSLPAGQAGELCARGPQIMKGYLNKPDANAEVFMEGNWYKTGDMAYYDDDGSFFIVDRLKELIKVKGFQVTPAELEEILRSHPMISEAAVLGVPDERAGELPKAFVVQKPGGTLTEEQVKEFVAKEVAYFKQLKGGVQFLDSLPKTPSGKILKRELRAK